MQYGDPVWTSEDPVPQNSLQYQLMMYGGGLGLGLGGLTAASRLGTHDWNPVDALHAGARYLGDSTPLGIGNTFRVPEFLSPLLSPAAQGLTDDLAHLSEGHRGLSWGAEYLSSSSTSQYLREAFGVSVEQMHEAGVIPGLKPGDTGVAEQLIFERTGDAAKGRLYTIVDGQRKELAENVALMQFHNPTPEIIGANSNINRAAGGIFRALNMWRFEGFKSGRVFSFFNKETNASEVPDFFPIPSSTGEVGSYGDLRRRTAHVRGVAAFEMDRFNKLASGFVDEFFGKGVGRTIKKVTGIGLETAPGPASATFLRYGGRAVGLGALWLGIRQTDWLRRQGEAGHLGVSAGISMAAAGATSYMGGGNKLSLAVGAASFMGQLALPGFDRGIGEGIMTVGANLDIARGTELNPFTHYRRLLEGYAPGVTGFETGALAATAAVAGAAFAGQPLLKWMGSETLGLGRSATGQLLQGGETKSSVYASHLRDTLGALGQGYGDGFLDRIKMQLDILAGSNSWTEGLGKLNKVRLQTRASFEDLRTENDMTDALLARMSKVGDIKNSWARESLGFATQAFYGFFGADVSHDAYKEAVSDMGFGKLNFGSKSVDIGPVGKLGKLSSAGVLAFAAHGILSGGFLGSMKGAQELREEYLGERLVEVQKGRWWEMGGTPFEGQDASYFRPSQYRTMMDRVRERGIWGADEDDMSPIAKFFAKNFSYELEERNRDRRPYPLSSTALGEIPIIGSILGATVGQLIKPQREMYSGEWKHGDMRMRRYQGDHREPTMELGGHPGVAPASRFDLEEVFSEVSYQSRQLSGFTGWARNIITGGLTGDSNLNTGRPMLADAGLMTDTRRSFLETSQGGALFMNEAIRRVFPNYRSDFQKLNPIRNDMPTWMPESFKFGDPYTQIEWGEARLPGYGYEAMHEELQGLSMEEYPLIHRYQILSDVSPHSRELQQVQKQLYELREQGVTNSAVNARMDQIGARLSKRLNVYEHETHNKNAYMAPGAESISAALAGAKGLIRDLAAPAEYMMPMGFRPISKFMGSDRDPIEQYEFERMYGTPMAFWDKPIRDWFRPAMYSAMHAMGWEGKPMWRQDADDNQAKWDELEFRKQMHLAHQAEAAGNSAAARSHLMKAAGTRTGIADGASAKDIYWALPDYERKFFHEFSNASASERDRIRSMIPGDQLRMYEGLWARMDAGEELVGGKLDRAHLENEYERLAGQPAPPDDWIGWHQDVDIRDIRIKQLHEEGKELADYGIWENELERVEAGAAYLDGSTDALYATQPSGYDPFSAMLGANTHQHYGFSQNSARISYNDYRDGAVSSLYREMMNA